MNLNGVCLTFTKPGYFNDNIIICNLNILLSTSKDVYGSGLNLVCSLRG